MTTNLKTGSRLNVIEEFLWFIAANVVLKTQTPQQYAPIAAHLYIQQVNSIVEANGNTTDECKTNVLDCPMVA